MAFQSTISVKICDKKIYVHQQSVGRLSFIYAREGQADDEGIPGKGISSVGSYVIFVSYVLACYVASPHLCSNIFKDKNC